MQAKDVMTSKVISVSEDAPVHDIVGLLLKHRISAVPVVDKGNYVVGMVSEGDLLTEPSSGVGGKQAWWLAAVMLGGTLEYDKLHASTASEVMTRNVVSVEEDTSLAEIARILERQHIKRVPVLRNGKLVGLVSRANLLHGLANDIIEEHEPGAGKDRAIRSAVVDALMHASLSDSHIINVTVRDGDVTLWGVVDSEDERVSAQRIANAIEGVRAVESHLGPGPTSGLPV